MLDVNRLFPADSAARLTAAKLYATVGDLPIISPHGHTDPRWFADNGAFPNPAALLIQPDHYIFRMLYSQGVSLESLGIPQIDGQQNVLRLIDFETEIVDGVRSLNGSIGDRGKGERDGVLLVARRFAGYCNFVEA